MRCVGDVEGGQADGEEGDVLGGVEVENDVFEAVGGDVGVWEAEEKLEASGGCEKYAGHVGKRRQLGVWRLGN
jgi:hypothetical protein